MSMVALLSATKTYIQANFKARDGVTSLDDTYCDVMVDGMPSARCGEEFFAIWPAQWESSPMGNSLAEKLGFNITYSRRMTYAPNDEWGTQTYTGDSSFFKRMEAFRAMMATYSVRIAIMVAANAIMMAANSSWGQAEPFRFAGTVGGIPEKKYADWWWGNPDKTACGLSITFAFRDAGRYQQYEAIS